MQNQACFGKIYATFCVKYGIRGTFYCHKISKKYTAYEALESMKR